jgi:hypothetical protein
MSKNPLTINEYALMKISPDNLCNLIFNTASDDDSSDNMHYGKAKNFLKIVLISLCELKDKEKLILNRESITEHLEGSKLLELLQGEDILAANDGILNYITSLPDTSNLELSIIKNLPPKTIEIHNYYRDLVAKKVSLFFF